MIEKTKVEIDKELLEAATSFKFQDIYIEVVNVPGGAWVEIRKNGKLYDKKTGKFVNMVNKYAVINGHILDTCDYQFEDIYQAYCIVQELLK